MHSSNPEVETIASLLNDFPINESNEFNPEDVIKEISSRYDDLYNFFLNENPISLRPEDYVVIIKSIHYKLCQGFFNNAGEFRKASDPKNGIIYFGGMKRHTTLPKFTGTPPDKIEYEVQNACSFLKASPKSPVKNSLRFYQEFVFTHPFYDFNGRIARLVMVVYLKNFNMYIRWNEINQNTFIKKLNKCHKTINTPDNFAEYFDYLVEYFSKYLSKIDKQKRSLK